jgi:peptidoglycan/LPS O-acetylase OafA/YrhL
MKYRAEIDGLRALAVLPVILFHAGFEWFSGGFVGVDVFFVISGYLITTIIISEMAEGKFSIVNFYERRARRILPALFFVMLACLPFAWLWLTPTDLKDFGQSLVAVSTFSSNILFWWESGYFDTAAELKPLLHTWSLAVEEQYYILFPVFLMLTWRLGIKWVLILLSIVFFISLGVAVWGTQYAAHPEIISGAFFLLPTRGWELLIGVFAAIYLKYNTHLKSHTVNQMLSLLGFVMIAYSIIVFDKITPFPSLYALIPTIGTGLLILCAVPKTLVHKLLSLKFIVGIGLISYSAYLWHQPLLAFARHKVVGDVAELHLIFLCIASLLMAWFSWRFVEKPFRNKEKFSSNSVFVTSILGLIFFAALGLAGHSFQAEISKIRFGENGKFLLTYSLLQEAKNESPIFILDNRYDNNDCRFSILNLTTETEERIMQCYERYGAGTMVFGDSHATNLYHSLVRNSENDAVNFLVGITKNGCHIPTNDADCQYAEILGFAQRNSGVFASLIYEKAGFLMLQFPNGRDLLRNPSIEIATIDTETINGVIEYLTMLGSYANLTWFGPRIEPLVSERELYKKTCDYEYVPTENHLLSYTQLDQHLFNLMSDSDINYISQNDAYTFSYPLDFGTCKGLLWMDKNHFSRLGEIEFGNRFNLLKYLDVMGNE